jgi:hypothetical protein
MLAKLWGEGTLIYCGWEGKLVHSLWKSLQRFFKKLKIEISYDPSIPLLGIYMKESKSAYHIYRYLNIHVYIIME